MPRSTAAPVRVMPLRTVLRRFTLTVTLSTAALTAACVLVLVRQAHHATGPDLRTLRQEAWGVGILGVLLTLAGLLVVRVTGRSLLDRVDQVRETAMLVAQQQIPELIRRLQQGEDVDTNVLPRVSGQRDELGAIGDALARLAQHAADAAWLVHKERDGFDRFAGIAATRSLLAAHGALDGLDGLQRRVELGADAKGQLAAVDARVTLLRRHLENLLLLANGIIPHPHSEPVPVGNVMLDTVGESQAPHRIQLEFGPDAWIVPEAAGALTHLLAELADNALKFSHQDFPVTVRCLATGNGIAFEVEDRGLGLRSERMAELSERLKAAPLFAEIAAGEQMGLFVVGRLAAQLGLSVTLSRSRYTGLCVVVHVPGTLLTRAPWQPAATDYQQQVSPAPLPAMTDAPAHTMTDPMTDPMSDAMTGRSAEPEQETPVRLASRRRPRTAPEQPQLMPEPIPAPAPAPASGFPSMAAVPAMAAMGLTDDGLPQRVPGSHMATALREQVAAPRERQLGFTVDQRSGEQIGTLFDHFPTAEESQ